MTELEKIAQLLAEVGPLLEEIAAIEQISEQTWIIGIDEVTAIEVHFEPAENRLGFSMMLAPVEPEKQLELYKSMLMYNSLKQDTGGFHMCLDGDEGYVHLLLDIYHSDLSAQELAAVLETILDTGGNWRAVILGVEVEEGDAASNPPSSIQV